MPVGFVFRSPVSGGTSASTYRATSATGTYPDIAVEIDFDTNPGSTPRTWTDVGGYVRSIQWQRGGRSHELQRTDAGTLTAVLDNRDGRFDPTNAAGDYYPNVKRMRWIRVMARWNSVEYPRWAGLIETWGQDWPSGGLDATVTIRAVDAFKLLNLYDLGGETFAEATTGERFSAVMGLVGLPFSGDDGQSSVVSTGEISEGSSALEHLQSVAETENGLIFADATGQVVFHDRHFRITEASSLTAVATVGDAGGSEIPYRQGQLDYDDVEVWPTVSVTPSGGTAETASDATSQALHFDRTLTRSILSDSQTEALAAAQWLSLLYADPAPRIPMLELLPQNLTTSWPTVLGLENSDRLTWKRSAAATITMDVFVERVSESAVPGRGWSVALQLSPASSLEFWLLGTAGSSELGETTTLAY